ncbi:hypothetical protein RN001_002665 [Aquatica leii]|uniref:ATR-interacting protein n=1 Tax=Aquatica leii TaxID=1421715 RepID=A0AAN7SLX9_9COLE|nr:hypothetical protein RN001_002665 [Aquatica leii]
MSKRSGNINSFNINNAKKIKFNETIDDLWGDDFDIDVNHVDDCILRATQCQQSDVCTHGNDVLILPAYNDFKQTSRQVHTSTQYDSEKVLIKNTSVTDSSIALGSSFKETQSFHCMNKYDNVELKLKQLEQQCETKSGEVGILRAKLQAIKVHHEAEQSKIQKEWTEKLLVKTKQLKGAESELEFKNLEILNLTQKLKEATKLNVSAALYPLKDIVQIQLFAASLQEMCLEDVNKKITCIKIQKQFDATELYLDIAKLAQFSTYELSLVQNQQWVSNLLSLSELLLQNLYHFLEKLEAGTSTASSQFTLSLAEICSERPTFKKEMGMNAKESIICISHILPHSNYLKQSLLFTSNCTYFTSLFSIVKFINELKLSGIFNCFLESIISLLNTISGLFALKTLSQNQIVKNLIKELIFCTAIKSTFRNFLKFLSTVTLQQNFLSSLCTNVHKNELQLTHEAKILCYTENTCVLQILFVLLEEYLKNGSLNNNVNALKLLSNSIRCNTAWLFYQEDKCPCLSKVVKLYIDVMYKTLHLINQLEYAGDIDACEQVLKSGIDTLYTLNFNLYDLVAKYIATFSQYKVVVKLLLNMQDALKLRDSKVEVLEILNKNEDIPNVSEKVFDNTMLWKNSILN